MKPEWVNDTTCDASNLPDLITIIGLLEEKLRTAVMNFRPFLMDSI
jgi:hypothetical protein